MLLVSSSGLVFASSLCSARDARSWRWSMTNRQSRAALLGEDL
jgi:hypothetical protein